MVYVYHSANTYYSIKKLDWREHKHMQRFHLKAGAFPIAKITAKLSLTETIVNRAYQILSPYITSHIQNPIESEKKDFQNYSEQYYTYKEGFNKHFIILINECTFYIKVKGILEVGFFDFPTIPHLEAALSKLALLAEKIGVSEILFQTDPDTRQYAGLSGILPAYPSWLIGYLPFDENLQIEKIGSIIQI